MSLKPFLISILAVSEKFKNIEAQCEEQMTKLKNIEGKFVFLETMLDFIKLR